MKNIIEDRIVKYLRSLIPESSREISDLASKCIENHVPIIEPEVAQLLLFLIKSNKPQRVLEIGTAVGYSAIIMGNEIKHYNGKITTIERNDARYQKARRNIIDAKLSDYIEIIYGDAADILPKLENGYDLVFLDAAKGQYLNFFPEIYRLLLPGGILVADNVLYRGLVIPGSVFHRRKKTMVRRLRKFLLELNANPNLTTSIIPLGDGVAVVYKNE